MNIRITPIIPALLVAAIGFSAPTLTSSSRRMYTPDPHSMDIVEDDDGTPRMEIRGFTTPTDARPGYNIADILTNNIVDVSNLMFIVRDLTGDDREVKYISAAKISTGSGYPPDEKSITKEESNGAVTNGMLSIYGFSTASDYEFPIRNGDSVAWYRFDGYSLDYDDAYTQVEIRGYREECLTGAWTGHFLFTGRGGVYGDGEWKQWFYCDTTTIDTMEKYNEVVFKLVDSEKDASRNKYAFLDDGNNLGWVDPTDGKSTELNDDYKVRLYGFSPGSLSLPFVGNGNLEWLTFSGSSSENMYLACDGDSIFWVNNPQKGDPGEPGPPGPPGQDGDPDQDRFYEWIAAWVATNGQAIVDALGGKIVTSVNEMTGDVVLGTLSFMRGDTVEASYDGSEDVEVPFIDPSADIPGGAVYAEYAGYAALASDAENANYAGSAGSAGHAAIADHANYALVAGEIGPPPNSAPLSAAKSSAVPTNSVKSAGLKFSARGSVLTITDGTHTWTLNANNGE